MVLHRARRTRRIRLACAAAFSSAHVFQSQASSSAVVSPVALVEVALRTFRMRLLVRGNCHSQCLQRAEWLQWRGT